MDACKKRTDYILRQFGFWLDRCRLDCGVDVGNIRAERIADEFDFIDLLESQPVFPSDELIPRKVALTYSCDGYSIAT